MKLSPKGKIVATGEDGVPWELYENGYLLFKPTKEKNTLTNPYQTPSWKEKNGEYLIAIGFTDKVFAPENSNNLFNIAVQQALSPQLQYIETSKIDTSKVTNMSYMFYKTSVKSLDVSNWDTSNVTDMSQMFYKAEDLTYLDVSSWDTSNVKVMTGMFHGVGATNLVISKWNTSKVRDMAGMFCNAKLLQMLNLSNWDTSNVENMSCLFYNTSIKTLHIEKWNTSKVVDMSSMFAKTNLTTLNIENWNTQNVEYMNSMFFETLDLKKLSVKNWNVSKVYNMSHMFEGALNLQELTLFKTYPVQFYKRFFHNNHKLRLLNLSHVNNSSNNEIETWFNRLFASNNINLPDDCVILLP